VSAIFPLFLWKKRGVRNHDNVALAVQTTGSISFESDAACRRLGPEVDPFILEAGIGKSRLTAALLERLATEPHTRLRYFCSPQHTDSALYPIISQMERAAGLAHDDTAPAKLDKIDAVLAQNSTSK
jgi:predicted ATPase